MNAEYTGKKIAEFRKAKNLTQKELANKLHVTDKAVSKWERGINFPDLGLMENLANELDATPSILLGLEDATKEEVVTSCAEISSLQSEEAEKDIQKIGWINLFVAIFLIIFMYFINIKLQRNGLYFESRSLLRLIYGLIAIVTIGAIYTLYKYKAIRKWEILDAALTEVLVVDVLVYLGIQLFTGRNPNYIWASILLLIGAVCLQLLFYRVVKPSIIKVIPSLFLLLLACWGVLLYNTSNAELGGFLVHYILPAIGSIITWIICKKHDKESGNIWPKPKVITAGVVIVLVFILLFCQDALTKTYVKLFHVDLEIYAEKMLHETSPENYGLWKVKCYPQEDLVEFHTGGAGLVFNSTYYGFYYSPDNTHKPFQGADDVSMKVNGDFASWTGVGDNYGKSTRLMDKWFWFEANF